MEFKVGKTKIRFIKGDITVQEVDAIVNAANSGLLGGGGVDGAIHRRAGPKLREECKLIRETKWPKGLPTGKAVITKGYELKAKHVIHTVGPVWHGGKSGEPELLADCYRNSLKLAISNGLKTIAFPAISTGVYGYPIWNASLIAIKTVKEFLEKEQGLDEVIFVQFSQRDQNIYLDAAKEVFS
ncbi:MAG: O-acetyl-ADP-ribose deacetylase [Candidatus Helarchaeota archaeon]